MSLTTLVNRGYLGRSFREEIRRIRVHRLWWMKWVGCPIPPQTRNFTLVGTAFDYAMRFHLKYINPQSIMNRWVAEDALKYAHTFQWKHRKDATLVVSNAKMWLKRYSHSGKWNRRIAELCLQLAELDHIIRRGTFPERFGNPDPKDVEDLTGLINGVRKASFTAKRHCLLNPNFGDATELVNGADADFVIDDTLWDIKTTKHLTFKRSYLYQLVGYYILASMDGIYCTDMLTGRSKTLRHEDIKYLGVYFSRFRWLCRVPINSILEFGVDYFQDEMREAAKKEAGDRNTGQLKRTITSHNITNKFNTSLTVFDEVPEELVMSLLLGCPKECRKPPVVLEFSH